MSFIRRAEADTPETDRVKHEFYGVTALEAVEKLAAEHTAEHAAEHPTKHTGKHLGGT